MAKRSKWTWYECLHHQVVLSFGVGPDDPNVVPDCENCGRPMTLEPHRQYPKVGRQR